MGMTIDFDAIKDTMVNIAQSGVAQGKKVATAAKLKADNMAQRDAIRKAYLAIGKQYFAAHRGEPEEKFVQLFTAVECAMAAIEANNAELAAMKVEPDVTVDVDVEMQAGEVPDDLETLIAQEMETADTEQTQEAPAEADAEVTPAEAEDEVTEADFAEEDIQE